MGSDSNNANPAANRPKWRDKHLKQLNNEQLAEVQAHRGESEVTSASLTRQAGHTVSGHTVSGHTVSNTRSASGPDTASERSKVSSRSAVSDRPAIAERDASKDRADRHTVDDSSGKRSNTDPSNRTRSNVQSRASDPRTSDRGDGRSTVRHAFDREYAEPDQPRRSRYEPTNDRGDERESARQPAFDDTRRDPRRSEARVHRQEPLREPIQAPADAAKPGAFKKLLSFKLPAPWKYALMAMAVVAMVVLSVTKPIDNTSESQLDSALTRAMIGFGLARTLNGVISVAQGTEFAVQPAGVGVNFSPGEILDPINDLVERFSWVMLLATSSIGVQKILHDISSWAGISVLLAGAGLFFLLTRLRNSAVASMADFAGKLLLLMLLVRFLIPLGAIANDWVYKQFLEPRFEESSQQLEQASESIREISARQTEAQTEPKTGSITDRAKSLYSSVTSKFDFDGMLDDYKNSAENVSEHAINLIVVFVMQTVLFPLLFLYLFYRLFRSVLVPSKST